jgi:hypothetical protein
VIPGPVLISTSSDARPSGAMGVRSIASFHPPQGKVIHRLRVAKGVVTGS